MERKRSDSVTGAVDAMQDALAGSIEPPAHIRLRDRDRPFWDAIIASRPRSKWDECDLENAANLARCKADIERIQSELDSEGDTLVNERGTVVLNPKHTLLETLTRRCIAMSRALHVHPEAKEGRSRDQGNKVQEQRKAGDAVKSKGNLIAMPGR